MNHRFTLGADAAVESATIQLDNRREGHRQLQPGARSIRVKP
ncbi:MAG TPA: hypothetical protein VKB28_10955 [Solirubrobacteraceae bacterium]|jgi:hypothetical protein|nr:hypothetical protein [Solirubrobacteraceae bacterium]